MLGQITSLKSVADGNKKELESQSRESAGNMASLQSQMETFRLLLYGLAAFCVAFVAVCATFFSLLITVEPNPALIQPVPAAPVPEIEHHVVMRRAS